MKNEVTTFTWLGAGEDIGPEFFLVYTIFFSLFYIHRALVVLRFPKKVIFDQPYCVALTKDSLSGKVTNFSVWIDLWSLRQCFKHDCFENLLNLNFKKVKYFFFYNERILFCFVLNWIIPAISGLKNEYRSKAPGQKPSDYKRPV